MTKATILSLEMQKAKTIVSLHNDPFTTFASHPGPDDAIYDEPPENIFQLFGHIFSKIVQIAAAFAGLAGVQNLLIARQFWWQRFTPWLLF